MSDHSKTRRSFLKGAAIAAGAYLAPKRVLAAQSRGSAVVVGAGAFGGWSALQLLRSGMKVTLVDTWGPGNARSTSGGESRIVRVTYGPKRIYAEMAVKALRLWQEYEKDFKVKLFNKCGMLWFVSENDSYEQAALPLLREFGVTFEQLSPTECASRWPQMRFDDVAWGLYEPNAGFLYARRACDAVFAAFLREGGEYRQAEAIPGSISSGRMEDVKLSSGETLKADQYVFACGPWLGKVFPFMDSLIKPTRQEVFFFGTEAGDTRFDASNQPVWIDNGQWIFYGFPNSDGRGFKMANDARGPLIDPTTHNRRISTEQLELAREYLRLRFPDLAGAPLIDSKVCQYESAPRDRFIIDRHPEAQNVLVAGGGSGHGFKHGPVVGEFVRDAVLDVKAPPAEMSFAESFKNRAR
ncbi:MAG: FAD-dependent oxidoreductase [Alphaproteobacteria bacterium]|nr:MAG: FAD-dependent oxidoreductase [Alphaproteobacteria bacterium]